MAEIRTLVVGCGTQGTFHGLACQKLPGCRVTALVDRDPEAAARLAGLLGPMPCFASLEEGLAQARPDLVVIATWPDTHAPFALQALRSGAHVFLEKPLAQTGAQAEELLAAARAAGRKLYTGYILRSHPAWIRFIEIARTLGKPLVMRMNLNQQSSGTAWQVHRRLMDSMSPIVDCGVHYIDVMCQMTRSRPVRVHAIGARLSDELAPQMYNYGQLQVAFADGSVGWYEAGWGPMISETAFFVKDVIGPLGSVSIVSGKPGSSADIGSHTRTDTLLLHRADRDAQGAFVYPDERIDSSGEPDHQELCERQMAGFLGAIRGDHDLGEHLEAALSSLRVVLAADRSVRTGQVVGLEG